MSLKGVSSVGADAEKELQVFVVAAAIPRIRRGCTSGGAGEFGRVEFDRSVARQGFRPIFLFSS
jgi:hypothetical protein